MNRNRSWFFLTISIAAIAASSVLVGMSNSRPTPDPEPIKGFTSQEVKAKDALKMELERRFTTKENVDFGMNRIVKKGWRVHRGPTMERNGNVPTEGSRRLDSGEVEILVEGQWIKTIDHKPKMMPENDTEAGSIKALKDAKIDVAIYALGQFERDRGEKAGPRHQPYSPNPHFQDFSYGTGESLRVKGPAYTSQTSTMAPRAYELVDFGRRAWASKQADYSAAGKDGWTYFAHRVTINDASCIRCHSGESTASKKVGDPVGLFVIALRRQPK